MMFSYWMKSLRPLEWVRRVQRRAQYTIGRRIGGMRSRPDGAEEPNRTTRAKAIRDYVGGSVLMILCVSGLQMPALSRDLDVTPLIPLQHVKPYYLDKATGIGPRFEFGYAPAGITSSCAKSIKVHVNEANFVDFVGARTSEEFRAKADIRLLPPSQPVPVHETYALWGQ